MRDIVINALASLLADVALVFVYGLIGMLVMCLWGTPWSWLLLWKIGTTVFCIGWVLSMITSKLK